MARPGVIRLSAAACSTLLGMLSSIVVARVLGPGAFGTYTLVLWLATAAVPVIGVGMSAQTSRRIAEIQSQQKPRVAAGIFRFTWRRQARGMLLYCAACIALALPFAWWFGANGPLLYLLLAGLTALPLLLSGVVGVTLRGLRRFDLLATIQLFGAVASLFLITVVAQIQGEHIGMFLLASALAGVVALVVGIGCVARLLPMREAEQPNGQMMERLTRGLSNSLPLFLLDAVVWQRSEVLLLGHWQSAAQLGFYSLSAILSTQLMEFSPMALSTCVLPLLARLPGHRYVNAADAYIKTSLAVALLAVPLCVLVIVCCPAIVTFCFGAAYLPMVLPLRLLMISATFGAIATVSLTHLANGERQRAQIRLGIAAASLNIALAIPLILVWGITGAAFASMVAQLLSSMGSIWLCWKMMFR